MKIISIYNKENHSRALLMGYNNLRIGTHSVSYLVGSTHIYEYINNCDYRFGDSYTEPVTSVNELRKLIERVKMSSSGTEQHKPANCLLSESERIEVAELEADMFDSPPLNGLLRAIGLYVARA